MSDFQPDPRTVIGHVHLKVADLERSREFYVGVLGMNLMAELPDALFFSFGDYHHEIGVNTWQSKGGGPPPAGTTGLLHYAIRVPDRKQLARVVKRLIEAKFPIQGAADHLVSEAIYFTDPDGNGIEVYADRPKEQWPHRNGQIEMATLPLDVDALMAELAE